MGSPLQQRQRGANRGGQKHTYWVSVLEVAATAAYPNLVDTDNGGEGRWAVHVRSWEHVCPTQPLLQGVLYASNELTTANTGANQVQANKVACSFTWCV
jgi:hypothetical protein